MGSTKADEGDTDFQMETNRKTKNSDNCKDVGEKCSKDPNKKCCDNLECNLEPLCCRANMPACYACKKKSWYMPTQTQLANNKIFTPILDNNQRKILLEMHKVSFHLEIQFDVEI